VPRSTVLCIGTAAARLLNQAKMAQPMFAIHTKAETNNNWCSLVVAPSRLIGETHLFVFCHSPELSVVRLISSSRKSAVILFKAFDYHSTVVSAIRNPRFTVRRLQFYQNFFIIIFAANFVTTTTRNRIYSQCSRIVRSLQWRRNEFESGGGHRSAWSAGKKFWSCPSTFWL